MRGIWLVFFKSDALCYTGLRIFPYTIIGPNPVSWMEIATVRFPRTALAAAFLLVLTLAGCLAPSGASPLASPTGAETASVLPTGTAAMSAVETKPTTSPSPAGPTAVISATAAASDTTPPVVNLSADPVEVPWLEQSTVSATAKDASGVVGLEVLLGDQVLATADDGDLSFDLIPGALDSVEPGGTYTLTARATDAAGNVGQASLAVRFGPASATPPAGSDVTPAAPESASTSPTATALLPAVSTSTTSALRSTGTPEPHGCHFLSCERDHPIYLSVRIVFAYNH